MNNNRMAGARAKKTPASLRRLTAPGNHAQVQSDQSEAIPSQSSVLGQTAGMPATNAQASTMSMPSASSGAIPSPSNYEDGGNVPLPRAIPDSPDESDDNSTAQPDMNSAMGTVMDALEYGRQMNGLGQGGQSNSIISMPTDGGAPSANPTPQSFDDGGIYHQFPASKNPTPQSFDDGGIYHQFPASKTKTWNNDPNATAPGGAIDKQNTARTLGNALGGNGSKVLQIAPKSYADGGDVTGDDIDPNQISGAAPMPAVGNPAPSADTAPESAPDNSDTINTATNAQGAIPAAPPQGAAPEAPDNSGATNAATNAQGETGTPQQGGPAKIVGYLKGVGAAAWDAVQQAEQQVDPSGDMPEELKKVLTVASAPDKGSQWGVLQAYRQRYDAFKAFAAAALTGAQNKAADIVAATKAATKAYSNIPDGYTIKFSPEAEPGGKPPSVTATVTRGHIPKAAPIQLSMQQFNQFLRGLPGQFDNLMDSDAVQVLKKLASSQGTEPGIDNSQVQTARTMGSTVAAPPKTGLQDYLTGVGQRASRLLPSTTYSDLPGEANINAPNEANTGAPAGKVPVSSGAPTQPQVPLQLPKGWTKSQPNQGMTVGASAPATSERANFDRYQQNLGQRQNPAQAQPQVQPPQQPKTAQQPQKVQTPFGAFDPDLVQRATQIFPTFRQNNKQAEKLQNYLITHQDARDNAAAAALKPQADPLAKEKYAARAKFMATNPSDEDVAAFDKRMGTNAPSQQAQPQQNDITYLKAHPEVSAQFDARFGKGASKSVLGNQ